MTKRIAPWWKRIFGILLVTTVIVIIAYSLGASKVSRNGAAINIDRSGDYQLFKVKDDHALYISPKYNTVSLATFEEAFPLWRLFGKYTYDKSIIEEVAKDGDWYYTQAAGFYQPGRVIAYNGATGETILKKEAANDDLNYMPPNLAALGLKNDASKKMRPEDLAAYEQLSVPKESAVIVSGGFIIAFVLWLLLLPFALRKNNSNNLKQTP